jgi:hypothetical protein
MMIFIVAALEQSVSQKRASGNQVTMAFSIHLPATGAGPM